MKGPPQPLDALHAALLRGLTKHGERAHRAFDVLCDELECAQCAAILCPQNHPMHLHHDGCPACAGHDVAYEAPAPVLMTFHDDRSVTFHEFRAIPAPGQEFAIVGTVMDGDARTVTLGGKFSQFGFYPRTLGES